MNKEIKFYSNYFLGIVYGSALLLFFILDLADGGFTLAINNINWFAFVILVLFVLAVRQFTYVSVSEKDIRISDAGTLWYRPYVNFEDIENIKRKSAKMIVTSESSWLVFIFKTKNGKIIKKKLHEPRFNTKTIKSMLTEIKKKAPHVKMSQQYQDLIDGKIPVHEFKSIPAIK